LWGKGIEDGEERVEDGAEWEIPAKEEGWGVEAAGLAARVGADMGVVEGEKTRCAVIPGVFTGG
jgi:hypothetical protein